MTDLDPDACPEGHFVKFGHGKRESTDRLWLVEWSRCADCAAPVVRFTRWPRRRGGPAGWPELGTWFAVGPAVSPADWIKMHTLYQPVREVW